MKNVLAFMAFALSHADPGSVPKNATVAAPVGVDGVWRYLYGTHGQVCTQELLDARYKSYYKKNGWDVKEYAEATRGWVDAGVRVSDCEGLLDAFLGSDVKADHNYRKYCTDKGLIGEISRPWVIGEAVFNGTDSKKTHVGWVCGFLGTDPLVVEERGIRYGCTITRMSKRAWKYRGLMKNIFSYEDPQPEPQPTDKYVHPKGNVRVRVGNGTKYKQIKPTATKKDYLPYLGQADEAPNWYKVLWQGQEGYISSNSRYTEVIEK